MSKRFKTFFTALLAVALVISLTPISASAAADNTVFLAYADEAWGNQYWGAGDAGNTDGVVGTDAEVTGPGQYTIAIDFTGTEAGKASGLAFTAPMIQGWEATHPGYLIKFDSIKVNGKDIAFTKNYTSCDNDGKNQTRSNIYNSWAGDITDANNNPRTLDGSLDGASAIIIDPADFAEVETISVTFTLIDPNASAGTTNVPKTGAIDLSLVYGLGALATGAVVFKKKVNK